MQKVLSILLTWQIAEIAVCLLLKGLVKSGLGFTGKKLTSEPFLDITDEVFTVFPKEYDERGLLGLTFHPNYPDSPYFYVNYIGLDSNSHISRFTVNPNNPNKALKSSEDIIAYC